MWQKFKNGFKMDRISKKFKQIRDKKKALSIFLTLGFPNLKMTEKLVLALEESGADLFEIGLPFSDPIADGPTIQQSSEIALKNGVGWKHLIQLGKNLRKKTDVPLILMSYSNPLYHKGWNKSARDLKTAGFDGVILPDLIPEENEEAKNAFTKNGLSLIYLVAPTSGEARVKRITKECSGFVYTVSVTGVTGARKNLPIKEVSHFLKKVKKNSSLPVLLGFGISKPEQLSNFQEADGFIIGSALVEILLQKKEDALLIEEAKKFINSFAKSRSIV
ncbi:MAG: tryptophan synthase subunit alpha [Elusimicrobia bacterium]|nr:tryptophan synthase subunit alpha [Elusimicrobiota bacterium]